MLRLVLALAAAVALAGCGGQSDEDAVRETVVDYFDAFAEQDAEGVCALMTKPSRDSLGGGDCAAFLARSMGEATEKVGRVGEDEVPAVTIEGDRAIVGPDDEDPLELQKVDGEWRIDGG
jgi:hypothetical protein